MDKGNMGNEKRRLEARERYQGIKRAGGRCEALGLGRHKGGKE